MAKRTTTNGVRRSGWPPVRSGRIHLHPVAPDDLALTILWILVLAGLVLLTIVTISTVFGWDSRLVSDADAKTLVSAGEVASPVVQGNPVPIFALNQSRAPGPDRVDTKSPDPDPAPSIDGTQGTPLPSFVSTAWTGDQMPVEMKELDVATSVEEIGLPGPMADVSASVGVTLGKVLEAYIHSDILGKDLPYRIYLPPNYSAGKDRYPVLYMLHGNGDGLWMEWTSDNRIGVVTDALISHGDISPMIIVMPDGEHGYFMNHYGDGERWQDYIVDEVIPFIDARYRTIADKAHRAIGGHSMGGTGALAIAFTHPEMFAAVGAHSPSLHWSSEGGPDYFGPPEYYAKYNPLELAKTAPGLGTLKIWVDFGNQDPWLAAGEILDPDLEARGADYEWHIFPGNHYNTYWVEHSPDYLRFYSSAFARMT